MNQWPETMVEDAAARPALRAAVIGVEPLARAHLRRLLAQEGSGRIEVVAECSDAPELIRVASEVALDVLFLDIDGPGCLANRVLDAWNGPTPLMVVITADAATSAGSRDARVTDILLKPVSPERVRELLPSLCMREGREDFADLTEHAERLVLESGRHSRLLPLRDIEAVIAKGNYVEICTSSGTHLHREPLHAVLERLGHGFLQLHRSAVVRIDAVCAVTSLGSLRYRIRLRSGAHVDSGRSYVNAVRELLRLKA